MSRSHLLVRNLPWMVSHVELNAYMSQFGPTANATVVFNHKTGLSRGYGYVEFKKVESLKNVLNKPVHVLDGNTLKLILTNKGRNRFYDRKDRDLSEPVRSEV